MKKYTKHMLLFFVVIILSVGCKKDDDDSNGGSAALIGTWGITGLTVTPPIVFGGVPITDIYLVLDPCEKDDTEAFNANGTYISDEGPTKCDPTDPQIIESGTWTLTSNNTVLTLYTSDTTVTNVITLTSSDLELSYTDDLFGTMHTFTATFTK